MKIMQNTAVLFMTGRDSCPDAFTPTHSGFATRALRYLAIYHHRTNGSLRRIIRRFNFGQNHKPFIQRLKTLCLLFTEPVFDHFINLLWRKWLPRKLPMSRLPAAFELFTEPSNRLDRLYNITRRRLGRIGRVFLELRDLIFQQSNFFSKHFIFFDKLFNNGAFVLHSPLLTYCVQKRKLPILTF